MSEYPRLFPERLGHARRALGWSWKDLAVRSQITLPTLEELMLNRMPPSVAILCQLADVLNVSTDYLVGRSDYLLDPAKPLQSQEEAR